MTKQTNTSSNASKTAADTGIGKRTRAAKPRDVSGQPVAASSKTKLDAAEPTATTTTPASKAPRATKAAMLRARLAEPGGVSLAALIEATGWQAHTLRAALSGLRKTGLTITRRREGTDTVYAIKATGADAVVPLDLGVSADEAPPAIPAASAG